MTHSPPLTTRTKHSPEQLVVGMAMKCKLHFLLSFAATAAAVVIIGFSTFRYVHLECHFEVICLTNCAFGAISLSETGGPGNTILDPSLEGF